MTSDRERNEEIKNQEVQIRKVLFFNSALFSSVLKH